MCFFILEIRPHKFYQVFINTQQTEFCLANFCYASILYISYVVKRGGGGGGQSQGWGRVVSSKPLLLYVMKEKVLLENFSTFMFGGLPDQKFFATPLGREGEANLKSFQIASV